MSDTVRIRSNRQFSALVDRGEYPDQIEVPLDAPFVNAAGEIQNLLLQGFTSAAVIRSVAGATRANHYHKTDWHYAYVAAGEIWYFSRPVGSTTPPQRTTHAAGSMFFTPPMVEHAMFFPVEAVFMTFARNLRDHDSHEADVVRVPLVEVTKEPGSGAWMVSYPSTGGR